MSLLSARRRADIDGLLLARLFVLYSSFVSIHVFIEHVELGPRTQTNQQTTPVSLLHSFPFYSGTRCQRSRCFFRKSLTNHRCLKHEVMPRKIFFKAIGHRRPVTLRFSSFRTRTRVRLCTVTRKWPDERKRGLSQREKRSTDKPLAFLSMCSDRGLKRKCSNAKSCLFRPNHFQLHVVLLLQKWSLPLVKLWQADSFSCRFFLFLSQCMNPVVCFLVSTRSHMIPNFVFSCFFFFLQVCPVENLLPLVVVFAMSEFFSFAMAGYFPPEYSLSGFLWIDSSCVGFYLHGVPEMS